MYGGTELLAYPKSDCLDKSPVRRPSVTLPTKAQPAWARLPLDTKIPAVWSSHDPVVLTRTKLGEPLWRTSEGKDFDATDRSDKVLSSDYQCLHDPNLKKHFSRPSNYKHLVQKKFIVHPSQQVVCSLKEFNSYRRYVRGTISQDENARRKIAEKEEMEKKQREARDKSVLQRRNDAKIQTDIEKRNKQKLIELKENENRRRVELLDKIHAKTVNQMRKMLDQMEKCDEKQAVRDDKAARILNDHLREKLEEKEGTRRKKFLKQYNKKERRRIKKFLEHKEATKRQKEAEIDARWVRRESEQRNWLQREDELKVNHSKFLQDSINPRKNMLELQNVSVGKLNQEPSGSPTDAKSALEKEDLDNLPEALPKRPPTDHVGVPRPPRTLPQGVPPMYERLQINAKLPRIWYPDDAITVSRGDLTEKLIQEYPNKEFDQSDIYQKEIPKEYNSLHDPYLSHYHWTPEVYEHLIGQKLITPDGRVKCSLKELNDYRQYLHRLWAMEANQFRRGQVDEVKEMLRILRKVEPTPEERKTLDNLAKKSRLFNHNPPYDLEGEIHQKLYREPREFLEKPTEEKCLAEKRLRAKKRAIKAQNRNLKELDDWLYEQSKFLRTYDVANYAKKKARDERLMGRWETHNKDTEQWVEEEKRLRIQNEIDRLRAMEERERQVQQHRDRQKKRLDAMNARRRKMVEKQYEAVKKRFEKWKLPEGVLTSSPKTSRVGETLAELDKFFERQEEEEMGEEDESPMDEAEGEPGEDVEYEQPASEIVTTGDLLTSTDTTQEGDAELFPPPAAETKSEMFAVRESAEEIRDHRPSRDSGYYDGYIDNKVTRSTTAFMDAIVSGVYYAVEGGYVKAPVAETEGRGRGKPPKEVLKMRDYKPGEETGSYDSFISNKVTPSTTAFMDALVSGVFNAEEDDKKVPVPTTAEEEVRGVIGEPPAKVLQVKDYMPGEETGCYSKCIDNKVTRSTTAFMEALVSGVYNAVEDEDEKARAVETNDKQTDESSIPKLGKISVPKLEETSIPKLDERDIPQLNESTVPKVDVEQTANSESKEQVDRKSMSSAQYDTVQDMSSAVFTQNDQETPDVPRSASRSDPEETYASAPENWAEEQRTSVQAPPVPEFRVERERNSVSSPQPESEQGQSEVRSPSTHAGDEEESMNTSVDFHHDIC